RRSAPCRRQHRIVILARSTTAFPARFTIALSHPVRGGERAIMWALVSAGIAAAVILARGWRSGKRFIDYLGIGLVYVYARLWHRWSSDGEAPLCAKGPAILVSNHTCSADPSFLTAGCGRVLSFMIAQEYYHTPLLRHL